MPLPKEQHKYTVDDILALPDGQRAELIDGQIYDMGTPTKTHQDILGYLFFSVQSHIMNNKGSCQAMLAPFSIFLNNDEFRWLKFILVLFIYMFTLVKSIYTTNTDFSKRCRYEDEVMV
jgi:hypothetical protein